MTFPKPILIVEDDEVDAEAVRRVLQKARILNPIHSARDGVEALEMLIGAEDAIEPCIMLLDINMPRMNGFELLRKLRDDERTKGNIVFMLTTSSRSEDREMAMELQAAGYVLKDDLDSLVTAMSDYCRDRKLPQILHQDITEH